jgi:hypothetical protein
VSAALISVAYVSTAADTFDGAALVDLLAQSRASNHDRDLTGMLLYRRGRFFQVLEGPEDAVDELMAKIDRDPRHADVRVLLTERLSERRFSEWTMGYEPIGIPAGPAPEGFRDTFVDLEAGDEDAGIRAVRELTVWFRARTTADA